MAFKRVTMAAIGLVGWLCAGPALAQTPPPAPASGTTLVLLGTGGGPALRKTRSQPASVLIVGGRPYLIDVGDGTNMRLTQANVPLVAIDDVFLTHLHFDHTAGIGPFMAFDWVQRRKAPVNVYGPPGTASLVKDSIQSFSISERIYAAEIPPAPPMGSLFVAHDLNPDGEQVVFQDDRVRVLAIENSHYSTMALPPQPYGRDRSYGYRFETPGRVVVFTGDSGPSDNLVQLAKGADVLVSEIINAPATVALVNGEWRGPPEARQHLIDHMEKEHMPPEALGKLAAAAGVKMVVLTHVVPGLDGETDDAPYVAGVKKYFSGPVVLGKDLDRF